MSHDLAHELGENGRLLQIESGLAYTIEEIAEDVRLPVSIVNEASTELIESGLWQDIEGVCFLVSCVGCEPSDEDYAQDSTRLLTRDAIRMRRNRLRKVGFTDEAWQNLIRRQGGRCALCIETKNLTIDHIIPKKRGGTDDPSNIQALCWNCNVRKGSKVVENGRVTG